MQITVVAVMCHAIANITTPVCHEKIVVKDDMTAQECALFSQPALAKWKAESIYSSDDWTIAGVKCEPGSYVIREEL